MIIITYNALLAVVFIISTLYLNSILINYKFGWPTSPPFDRPYLRALNPIKVLQVNRELLSNILSIRYINLFIAWKRFYNTIKPPYLYKVGKQIL